MLPAFKSCILSPAIAAAQQTTAPIMIDAAGPFSAPEPINARSISADDKMVAMVTPEMGLFELPTNPAIYPATAEKRNPAITMIMVINNDRSEEHTSELQSRGHLVCRLLLEK